MFASNSPSLSDIAAVTLDANSALYIRRIA